MQVNIHEAKTNFSKFVDRASKGEEIIIARAGKPLARLVPIAPVTRKPREPGFLKDYVVPDEAFAPMTEEELKDWES